MNRDRVLEKIRKCLALGNSANEHEAAAAMRQARRLMELHGLQSSDPAVFDVTDREVKTSRVRPPRWFILLSSVVGEAFSCTVMSRRNGGVIFVGSGAGPEVAAYTFLVLSRMIEAQKRAHINHPARRDRITRAMKIRAGKAFCEGWVAGVGERVEEFAQSLTDEQRATHQDFMKIKSGQQEFGDKKLSKSAVSRETELSARAGYERGKQVELKHGVGERAQGRLC